MQKWSRNKVIIVIFVVLVLVIAGVVKKIFLDRKESIIENDDVIVNDVNSTNVIAKDDLEIYEKQNNDYVKVGKIYKDNYIKLASTEIISGEYFLLDGFNGNYYIDVNDVLETDKEIIFDNRYKNYVVFNKNIVTNDSFDFVDGDGNKVYSFDFKLSLPIIINDTDYYGVEYNNRLLFVEKEDVKEVIDSNNTNISNTDGIRVLNYHFFYEDENLDGCYEEICASESQFRMHLDFFKEQGILTLKMNEVEMYIDGKIQLPKSVLITIDDGFRTEVAVDLLNEYKMYGTIFLVTSWFDVDSYYKNEYVELHSHGDNIHEQGVCAGGQGGAIKCLDEEKLIVDLQTSSSKLNGSKVLAYPFYEYNDYSIEVLKKVGYTMAFAGESTYSDNLIHVDSNKFKLPRFVVVNYTTMNDLKKYFGY